MFVKLAVRNVRRQVGNYLVYFITVSLTVALIFAVNSVIYSDLLQQRADEFTELATGLTMFSIFISAIVAFVLSYASSFMLKLRKREFGTYLTLGMTRRNLLAIFTLETLILGAAALGAGIVLGLFLYQGLMLMVTALLDLPFIFAAYSLSGLGLTVLLVAGVFLLSSLTSALYLQKVSIHHLIHGARKVEKTVRFPFLWLLCALFSLYTIAACCVLLYRQVEAGIMGTPDEAAIFWIFFILALAILLFHIGFARSGVFLLLKNKTFRASGTNVFVLRQLSGKLKANSVMLSAVAFLTVFAVAAANIAFMQKISEDAALERGYPYDISGTLPSGDHGPITLEESRETIEAQAGIETEIAYSLYTSKNGYLHSFTPWSGENYSSLYDTFMTVSDFNRIYGPLGVEPLKLDNTFAIFSDVSRVKTLDFSQARLKLNGKTYTLDRDPEIISTFGYIYFLAVIPDEAAAGMTVDAKGVLYNVKNKDYDYLKMHDALSYQREESYENSSFFYTRSDFTLKEYARMERNGNSAIFLVGSLYIGLVFILLAMAILALKTLSGMSEDRERYRLLSHLGTDRRLLQKTLFRQTAAFFFLPYLAPVLLCIPTGMICVRIAELSGFAALVPQTILITVLSALVFSAIYLLYFAASYLIAKRNLLKCA